MATRLPDIFHTSPDFEGTRHDVVIKEGYREDIEGPIPIAANANEPEAAWHNVTPLGYGEVIRAYRALQAEGVKPTEAAIAERIHGDETLAGRLAGLQREEGDFEPPAHWFDGHDNTCKITLETPDKAEKVLFHSFASMLFRSRVGIGLSSMTYDDLHHEEISFGVRGDWAAQGAGTATVPIVEAYFPEADIVFAEGFERVPLPGHPKATPGGFGDPKNRFISSADLPDHEENPEAWARSLAMQARNIFEGPPFPDVATEPKFKPLLTSLQEGAAALQQLQADGVTTWDELRKAALAWEMEHGQDLYGERIVIYPKSEISYRYPLFTPSRNRSEGHATPYTTIEGYIVRAGAAQRGELLLVGGVHVEAEPDYIPMVTPFTDLRLSNLLGIEGDDPEVPGIDNLDPAVGITGPSERELPDPSELLERYKDFDYKLAY